MKKVKRHIAFWIIFPIVYTIVAALLIFLFDLTNGPLIWFIVEIALLVALVIFRVLVINRRFWVRLCVWAGFFALTFTVLMLSKPSTEVKSAAYYKNPQVITETLKLKDNMEVEGIYNKDRDVEIYAGIKYATAERWKLPQEYTWEGKVSGASFGARMMQPKSNPIMDSLVNIYAEKGWHPNYKMVPEQNKSEDALYLNIWKPVTEETNLPILVFIHGGSLTNGSSAFEDYNGESIAKKGVIMITIQYRLSVFGYFAHPDLKAEALAETGYATTGNYGLLDQIEALKWVNKYATRFGGNPENITIAGESAGSSSVSALCTSPLAKGLFKRAIGESSSLVMKRAPHTYRTEEKAYETSSKILEEFNCKSIADLRKIPAEKLVETSYKNSEMMMDGYALNKDPYQVYLDGENNEEALLNGYNVLEADAFVIPMYLFSPTSISNFADRLTELLDGKAAADLYNLLKDDINKDAFSVFNEIFSVYYFIMPHHVWSNMALNNGVDVYRYQFTKENGFYGTYHSGEMIYCYGNIDKSSHSFAYNSSDYSLSEKMVGYWSNFAKNGNPNGTGLPTWQKYQNSTDNVQELGLHIGSIADKYLSIYNILDAYLDRALAK